MLKFIVILLVLLFCISVYAQEKPIKIEKDLAEAKSRLNALEKQIKEKDLAEAKSRLNALEKQIEELEKQIKEVVTEKTKAEAAAKNAEKDATWTFRTLATSISLGVFILIVYGYVTWRGKKEVVESAVAAASSATNAAGSASAAEQAVRITIPQLVEECREKIEGFLEDAETRIRKIAGEETLKAGRAIDLIADAKLLNQSGQYKQALFKLDEVIKLSPNIPEAYIGRGIAKARISNSFQETNTDSYKKYNREAVEDYTKAAELYHLIGDKAGEAWAYSNRIDAKMHLGDYNGSIEDAKLSIDTAEEDFAISYYNWACTLALRGEKEDKQEMLDKLKKSLDMAPDYRKKAREDKDFESFWEDPDFIKLVGN